MIIGINEATKGTQDHEQKRRDASRKQRSHLIAICELTAASGRDREQIHGAKFVLRNGNVRLNLPHTVCLCFSVDMIVSDVS
jgi:hypothetical protein